MTKNQNKVNCEKNLIEASVRLITKNVPLLVVFQHKGVLMHYGTKEMCGWFNDIGESMKDDLKNRMIADMVQLVDGSQKIVLDGETIDDRVHNIYNGLNNPHPSGLPLLPFPLHLMSMSNKREYVSKLIRLELDSKKIQLEYGNLSSKPSFWRDEEWNWSDVKESLFKVSQQTYTGKGSWTNFLTKTIEDALSAKNIDPQLHVEDVSLKQKTLNKKKRMLGIHDPVSVVISNPPTESSCIIPEDEDTNLFMLHDSDSANNIDSGSLRFPSESRSNLENNNRTDLVESMPSVAKISGNIDAVDELSPTPISLTDSEGNIFVNSTAPKYMPIPDQVKDQLPGYVQQYNSGKGLCLFKSAVQHISEFGLIPGNVSCFDLRRFVHQKIVEWWDSFVSFFSWPHVVLIVKNGFPDERLINTPEEYFDFLLNDDSLFSYSESEVDLWALSFIMNTNIATLSYNVPVGKDKKGRTYQWHFYEGAQDIGEENRFSCRPTPLYLLNEHLSHWTRLVPDPNGSSLIVDEERLRGETVMNPDADKLNETNGKESELVASEDLLSDTTDIGIYQKVDNNMEMKDIGSGSKISVSKRKKQKKCEFVGFYNARKVKCIIRNLKEGQKYTAGKSEMYFKFKIKEATVEELLREPTTEQLATEAEMDILDETIKARAERHEMEMQQIEDSIQSIRQKQQSLEDRIRENGIRKQQLQLEVGEEKLLEILSLNIPYLEKIIRLEEYSPRHEAFRRGGAQQVHLIYMEIFNPFSDEQVKIVVNVLRDIVMNIEMRKDCKEEFIAKVLLPEALIKVYMDVFQLEKAEAETRIFETPMSDDEEDTSIFL